MYDEFSKHIEGRMPFGITFEMIMEQITRSFYIGHLKYGTPIGDYKLSPGWATTDRALTQAEGMGIFLDYFSNGSW